MRAKMAALSLQRNNSYVGGGFAGWGYGRDSPNVRQMDNLRWALETSDLQQDASTRAEMGPLGEKATKLAEFDNIFAILSHSKRWSI